MSDQRLRFLRLYEDELRYIRDDAHSFSETRRKSAGHLGKDPILSSDPFVERLLEGFAFLTARIQMKMEAQFPRFTSHLLEMVQPSLLAPVPSMTIVQFQAPANDRVPAEGCFFPAGRPLMPAPSGGRMNDVRLVTAHDVTLLPLALTEAQYLSPVPNIAGVQAAAAIRLRLRCQDGTMLAQVPVQDLPVFVHGQGIEARQTTLLAQLFSDVAAVVLLQPGRPVPLAVLPADSIAPMGFEPEQAVLPVTGRAFDGYRLLHEYFAMPERFSFARFTGLHDGLAQAQGQEFEILVMLKRVADSLPGIVDHRDFALHCTPAVNLFPMRTGNVDIDLGREDFPLPAEPPGYVSVGAPARHGLEIHSVRSVTGYAEGDRTYEFHPFFAGQEMRGARGRCFYTLSRRPSLRPGPDLDAGAYHPSDLHIALVDGDQAPFSDTLRYIQADLLCTNGDLSARLPQAALLRLDGPGPAPAPVIRCLTRVTKARPALAESRSNWHLISHLTQNYLSLCDMDGERGAAALREMLSLYADAGDAVQQDRILAVRSVAVAPVTLRYPGDGPPALVRGQRITLTLSDAAFEGQGAFLLAAVLERFFARHASVNSFTSTVLISSQRGKVMEWPARIGRRYPI